MKTEKHDNVENREYGVLEDDFGIGKCEFCGKKMTEHDLAYAKRAMRGYLCANCVSIEIQKDL